MHTAIRTSLLCDSIPFPDVPPLRKRNDPPKREALVDSRSLEATRSAMPVSGGLGVQLGTYTVIGSHVTTMMRNGEQVISFVMHCSRTHRVHYPAAQVVQTRVIGQQGGYDLVELTIAFWRSPR